MSNTYSLTNNYQIQNNTLPIMAETTNFFSPIHNTHITELPPGGWAQNFSPILFPQNNIKYPIKKKTLILDLDETLVHSSMRPFPKCADITLHLNFNGRNIFIYVLKRPFLEKFLEEMSLIYDIMIFTASLADYSEPLLDIIDKNKIIKYRLNRSHCRHYQNIYIKDLKVINRDLKDMIIVDNNPESYLMNKENAIPILTWEDDINDNELMKLIPVLKYLAKVDDVRTVINQIVDRNNEIVDFNAFNRLANANNKMNNTISRENLNIISNKNIINTNPNLISNKIVNNIIPKNNETKNINKNNNNNNINYNINKRIYIKKEITGNGNFNKRISFPINTNNKYIVNNHNNNNSVLYNKSQDNLYPKDSQRKIGSKTFKLNIDTNEIQNQYGSNLYDKKNLQNEKNIKERMNTSPFNQINVSNSTINIFNNKPEIKILVNGPNQKPDLNKIKKIRQDNLTPIRSVKNKNINYNQNNRASLITPIKDNYNNQILTNPNYDKTYDNKITKTVSVRKLFEQPNHSSDNIIFKDLNLQKQVKAKAKIININNNNNNGFAYNQNMVKFMKSNNVKNNNYMNYMMNNKIIKMEKWDNNYKNPYLRNEKSMNDLNIPTKIKKIEVIQSKRIINSPDRTKKIKAKVKSKETNNNKVINNYKIKEPNKMILERESFNRAKFLRDNFGIVV